MRLIVGLGNPGPRYARNRHNIGFLGIDEIARVHRASPFRRRFQGEAAEVVLGAERAILLKPQTFMNESGRSVAAALRFYKLPPALLLVVHDEGDFDRGRLQARLGGGLAGHNGLRSIARQLGTNDFLRLRVGVGRPGRGDPRSVSDWVLSDFAPEEDAEALVTRAADAVETLTRDGLERTQQRFN